MDVEIWLDTKKIDLLIFFIGFFHKMNDSTPLYPTEHLTITRKKCVLVSVTVFILIIMMTLIAVTVCRSSANQSSELEIDNETLSMLYQLERSNTTFRVGNEHNYELICPPGYWGPRIEHEITIFGSNSVCHHNKVLLRQSGTVPLAYEICYDSCQSQNQCNLAFGHAYYNVRLNVRAKIRVRCRSVSVSGTGKATFIE